MDLSPRDLGTHETDIHGVIGRALQALDDAAAQARVRVSREFDGTLPALRLDEAKIEQVFVNLFTNAIQATPQGGGLVVRTGTKVLGEGDVSFDAGDRSGARFRAGERVVQVDVEDTGCGVARENLDKVFEPFFSTKPTGQGMGLGLTVARKMVELHQGTIAVRNRPEGGVRVELRFRIL
jgi:two-component system NtrC family sensor kinase